MLFLPGGIVSYINPPPPPPPNPQNLKKEQNASQVRKHALISSLYCLNFVDKD